MHTRAGRPHPAWGHRAGGGRHAAFELSPSLDNLGTGAGGGEGTPREVWPAHGGPGLRNSDPPTFVSARPSERECLGKQGLCRGGHVKIPS